ncbi:MAG: hypothetical protein GKS03_11055 [Alphaproteobacteria bacterium]|nr:hypothetical protein [Alphaproteobacteria bacterium]
MFRRILTATVCVFVLSACAEMPRHSNTLFFGTNTLIGLEIGQGATQTPGIDLGYKRQELAIVPLLANKFESCGTSGCKLVPQNCTDASCQFKGKSATDEDTLSVLASFGAKFNAESGQAAAASGGLAQYFATGLAARKLAEVGGSSLVALGPAATASAESAGDRAAVEAQIKIFEEEYATGMPVVLAFVNDGDGKVDPAKATKLAKIVGLTREDPFDVDKDNPPKLSEFEKTLSTEYLFAMGGWAEKLTKSANGGSEEQ